VKIADVEWIGPAQAEKLNAVGVVHDDDLMVRGATRTGRNGLAAATGIGEPTLLGWIRRLELLRLDGVGPGQVDLLIAAGVSGASDLAERDPHHLAATLVELSRTRATARQAPLAPEIAGWIEAARGADAAED
jgi:predicted flap endonuclease-1-like 5' DNA nuclease